MQQPASIKPRKISHVVGCENHAVADGVAREVLVTGSAQIDLVDVDRMEASATRKSHEAGAQVFVDQELELAGLKPSLLLKA